LIACVAIALESTATMSARHTNDLLRPIFERIFGHINDKVWWWAHHLFRKGGHLSGYGLVCLTFLRAWLLTLAQKSRWTVGGWRRRSVLLAIGCTFIVAGCDEWHQTYLPGRTGAFSDVVLDTVGASIMCLLVSWIFRWRTAKTPGLTGIEEG
jgi:VanZ family protein